MFADKPTPTDRLTAVLEQAAEAALARRGRRAFQPPFDLKDDGREYILFVDLPGVDEDEIDISLQAEDLVVSGVREFDHDNEDAEEFVHIERPYGNYLCCVTLTDPVDFTHVTAKYRRGVLKVRVPKLVHFDRRNRAEEER
jgi:HSP20 family protein